MEDSFAKLYKDIRGIFGQEKLTSHKIIVLTPRIVKFVQEVGAVRKMSGVEKKELLLSVVRKMIEESDDLSEDEKSELQLFIDLMFPLMIDAIVYAYKSDAFKKIKSSTKKCLGSCMK